MKFDDIVSYNFDERVQEELQDQRLRIRGEVEKKLKELLEILSCTRVRLWRYIHGYKALVVFSSVGEELPEEVDSRSVTLILRNPEIEERHINNLQLILNGGGDWVHPLWDIVPSMANLHKDYTRGSLEAVIMNPPTSVPVGVVCIDKHSEVVEAPGAEEQERVQPVLVSISTLLIEYYQATLKLRSVESRQLFSDLHRSFEGFSPADFGETFRTIGDWAQRIRYGADHIVVGTLMYVHDRDALKLVDGSGEYFQIASLARDRFGFELRENDPDSITAFAFATFRSGDASPIVYPDAPDRVQWEKLHNLIDARERRFNELPADTTAKEDAKSRLLNHVQQLSREGTLAVFPIYDRDNLIGVYAINCKRRSFFNDANREIFGTIAGWIGVALGALRRDQSAQERQRRDVKDRIIYGDSEEFRKPPFQVELDDLAAIFAFDLDNFKKLNDTHGHETGDEILREIKHAMLQETCQWHLDREAKLEGRLPNKFRLEDELELVRTDRIVDTTLFKAWHSNRWMILPVHFSGDEFGVLFRGSLRTALDTEDPEFAEIVLDFVRRVVLAIKRRIQENVLAELRPSDLTISAGICFADSTQVKRAFADLNKSSEPSSNSGTRGDESRFAVLRSVADVYAYEAKRRPGDFVFSPGLTVIERKFSLRQAQLDLWFLHPQGERGEAPHKLPVGTRLHVDWSYLVAELLLRLHPSHDAVESELRYWDKLKLHRKMKKVFPQIRFEVISYMEDHPVVRQLDSEPGFQPSEQTRLVFYESKPESFGLPGIHS